MSVKIGHASRNEKGKAVGGAAGDQTGKEVCIRNWYKKSWTHVLRPKSKSVAEKIAAACRAACANDNIGYDQKMRTTLYRQAEAVQFNLSRIRVKCACDCSSFVAVCVNAAGVKVSRDIYTGSMVKALTETGSFEVLTDKKYLTSDQYLKVGDILVCKGHTVMVLENGAESVEERADARKSSLEMQETETPISYKVKITASFLNVRKGPGTSYGIVTTIKKGEIYRIVEEEKKGGTVWGRLEGEIGYISLKYAEKC